MLMFDEVDGLPLHPLAVHASVVLIPLAALLAILFVVPRTRAWARLPLLLVSLGSVLSVFVTRESGFKLKDHLAESRFPYMKLIEEHQSRANLLFVLVIIFAVVAIAAYVLSARADLNRAVSASLSVLLVVGAVALAVQTYRVGELGSRIVWNPDGKQDFSTD